MRKTFLWACVALLLLAGCRNTMKKIDYPLARADSSVSDNYFGTIVHDPYRWMEEENSPELKTWIERQNALTENYLKQIPYREGMRRRLSQLWNYPRTGIPTRAGEYYFFTRNDGLQPQASVYRQKGLEGTAELFLDPNKLSADGTTAITSLTFSEDGCYMACALSDAGSDWARICVMECATGRKLPDEVRWIKFSAAEWSADSKGFYYSRYDEPREGEALSAINTGQKVYYHRLGEAQQQDTFVYSNPENPKSYFWAAESRDGKYLFINFQAGTNGSEILWRPTSSDRFEVLFKGFENDYSLVESRGDRALFLTNNSAPNFRLVEVDLRTGRMMRDVIPEDPDRLLEGVTSCGGRLFAVYQQDAQNIVLQYDRNGKPGGAIYLPAMGSVGGFDGKPDAKETFYAVTNFVMPGAIYRYDLETNKSTIFAAPKLNYDPSMFTVEQVFFTGADSTRIPMFIVHRNDMRLDGSNPLYLYGYGGFNISLTPAFNPAAIMFMEQGGVYVTANIRGGGEYGERWHRAGMLGHKQTVFDDFIAAAEYLVAHKYTSPGKLAIAGGSNGGLLVGACMTQRPDLFAVALPAVGVMDMLRYQKFTVGWGWAVEYGTSDDAEQFGWLIKYSPLHNIRSGVSYPATLITTADHDDRVVPAHSFKFAATLQAAQSGDRPVLIRIDTRAGHGAGKPTQKKIDEVADIYSFLFWNTGTRMSEK